MIIIKDGKQESEFLSMREYYRGRSVAAKIIMLFTKRLRAYYTGSFIEPKEKHLDIGCGDGYFMKRSPCRYVFGTDAQYGDTFTGCLPFPDQYFDYVTMLAVIEHLDIAPMQIFCEVHRVLKQGGHFVFTTPKQSASLLIKLYARDIEEDHCRYYTYETVKVYSQGLFRIRDYRTFFFSLNQVYCLKKE